MHDDRPAAPTMAAMTVSTSSCAAIVSSAPAPHSTRVASPADSSRGPGPPRVLLRHHGQRRPEPQALLQHQVDLEEALRANTSKRPG